MSKTDSSWRGSELRRPVFANDPFGNTEIEAVAEASRLLESAAGVTTNGVGRSVMTDALTLVDAAAAGRANAAYGGVYITVSLFWLWAIEGIRPDRWDVRGAAICLVGAGLILFGPRPVAGMERARTSRKPLSHSPFKLKQSLQPVRSLTFQPSNGFTVAQFGPPSRPVPGTRDSSTVG